jgi:hypothetical protein
MAIVAIDLGTCHARALLVPDDGEPAPHDAVVSPAVVTLGHGMLAGEAALMVAGGETRLFGSIKRLLGRSADDPLVTQTCERHGLTTTPHGSDLAISDGKNEATLGDITSELLRYVAELAAGARSRHDTVLVVPAWYSHRQRDALASAARAAQLGVLRLVQDTVASALWMASAHGERGKLAIVDAGAGGVSVALLSARDGSLHLEASRGSADLGGDDIDHELCVTLPRRPTPAQRERVLAACERVKRELATSESAREELVFERDRTTVSAERWQLDLMLEPLAQLVERLTTAALADAGWRAGELDRVFATGGMSGYAPIRQRIRRSLGADAERPPGGLECAVTGAALQAAVLALKSTGLELDDGERRPRGDSTAPPRKRAKSPFLAGPVTTHRKQPERFRPAVTRLRRTRSMPPPTLAERALAAEGGEHAPVTSKGAPKSAPVADSASDAAERAPAPAAETSKGAAKSPPAPAAANAPRAPPAPKEPIAVPHDSSAKAPSRRATLPAGYGNGGAAAETPSAIEPPATRRSIEIESEPSPIAAEPAPLDASPPTQEGGAAAPTHGHLYRPRSATEVLGLAITRPLEARDLEPIALPVLLRRVLARRSVFGSLVLRGGTFEMEIDIESGSAALTRAEHTRFLRAFDVDSGTWTLSSDRLDVRHRDLYPLVRLSLDGIKRWVRALPGNDLDAAFGELLDFAPQIRPENRTLPKRLGLGGRELRFVESMLDGSATARTAADTGGLGPTSTLQLLAVLELHDALMWTEVGGRAPSPEALVRRRTLHIPSVDAPPARATRPFEQAPRSGDDGDG